MSEKERLHSGVDNKCTAPHQPPVCDFLPRPVNKPKNGWKDREKGKEKYVIFKVNWMNVTYLLLWIRSHIYLSHQLYLSLQHHPAHRLSPLGSSRFCMSLHSQKIMEFKCQSKPVAAAAACSRPVLPPQVLSAPRWPVLNNCEWHLRTEAVFAFGNQQAANTAHRLHSTQNVKQEEAAAGNVIYPPPFNTLIRVKQKVVEYKGALSDAPVCPQLRSAPSSWILHGALEQTAKRHARLTVAAGWRGTEARAAGGGGRINERNVSHSHLSAEDCKVRSEKKKDDSSCENYASADERLLEGRHWRGIDQHGATYVCFQTCLMSPPSCAVPVN